MVEEVDKGGPRRELAGEAPGTLKYRDALAWSQVHLGAVLEATGPPEEAAKAYRTALELYGKSGEELPGAG